eukprot:1137051-Pelagomonas_calceolata.AAC.2
MQTSLFNVNMRMKVRNILLSREQGSKRLMRAGNKGKMGKIQQSKQNITSKERLVFRCLSHAQCAQGLLLPVR